MWRLPAIACASLLVSGGCGHGQTSVTGQREPKPVWCPLEVVRGADGPIRLVKRGGGFDARKLVGLELGQAQALARRHGCVIYVRNDRPVVSRGHEITVDLALNRIHIRLNGQNVVAGFDRDRTEGTPIG
jgi:hypothetical protein